MNTHAYIGTKPCGCVVAAVVDDGSKNVQEDVTEFVKAGYSVQYKAIADVKLKRCVCEKINGMGSGLGPLADPPDRSLRDQAMLNQSVAPVVWTVAQEKADGEWRSCNALYRIKVSGIRRRARERSEHSNKTTIIIGWTGNGELATIEGGKDGHQNR